MDDLIVARPEALSLIRISDRVQPDFCEICGEHRSELFSAGKYMACIPCSKDASKLRRYGVYLPDGGITLTSFMQRLAQHERLIKYLFGGNNARH